MNRLHYGDCLTVMADMPLASVDLIYLDPPFNSQRQYNSIYKDETGRPLPDQIDAFCDMWLLDSDTERIVRRTPILMQDHGIDDATVQFWKMWTNALRETNPRLLAYLSYMVQRLLQMRVILKPTGSIYLHCDPTVSHYVKIMMDTIFGHANFQNEIIWYYTNASRGRRRLAKSHDVILWYSRGDHYTFNRDDILVPFQSGMTEWRYTRGGQAGQPMPKGKTPDDVFIMPSLNPMAKERMGYATQKPVDLLDWLVKSGSNPGDVVLDPFCGCATTLEAAHTLGRRWIGIDIAIHAVKRIARQRLTDRLGLVEGEDFEISGVPRNVEGAQDLWTRDKYHFQKWAVEQADGYVTAKKTADRGVDGRLYFDTGERDLQSMVLEVKGGRNVTIRDVRDLRGVLERDAALLAGLIVLHPPSTRQRANFEREMAAAGVLTVDGVDYPRMQLITAAELLAGQRFDTPRVAGRHEPQPALPGITS